MINRHSLRSVVGTLALASILFLLALNLTACSDSTTDPVAEENTTAPTLPPADQLVFDFSFFAEPDAAVKADGTYDHFVNAYLRVVVLDAMAHLVLAAPVSAFSAAVNTVPQVEDDGSWVWTYDWIQGSDSVTIVLRGLPVDDTVHWSLGLRPRGSEVTYEWFYGETGSAGQSGLWSFRDLDEPGFPVSGEISWGSVDGGTFLQFHSLEEDSFGDILRFEDRAPDYSVVHTDGLSGISSFIRWNDNGEGSLRVPDYNEGLEACWDQYQQNTVCR